MREWRVVIRVRGIDIAVVVSLLLHALLFALPGRQPVPPAPAAQEPMTVVIAPPVAPRPAEAQPQAAPPRADPVPRPVPRRPAPRPEPRIVEPGPVPPAPPQPTPAPQPEPQPPAVDMLAMIEARRAQRRAAEAAAARGTPPPALPPGDPTAKAIERNLNTLSGGQGVSGVFEVLYKGPRTGQFAFNGWRTDARRQWREVIEVDAGVGGNVELAIVRRMIELIRSHYKEDFYWDSHRLGEVRKLSARPEDNEYLEDFLMREFFGQPTLNPRRQR